MKFLALLSLISSFSAKLGPCPNPEKETCLRGGIPSSTCTGLKCAPCWIHQDEEHWGCYEFLPGTNATCPFPNMVNIRNPPKECQPKPIVECPNPDIDTCFHGGMDAYPCLDTCCPRCWIKSGSKWGCYEPKDGKCEWDNMIDIDNPPSQCAI